MRQVKILAEKLCLAIETIVKCHSLVSHRDHALEAIKLSISCVVTIFNSVSSHQRLVRSQHRAKFGTLSQQITDMFSDVV